MESMMKRQELGAGDRKEADFVADKVLGCGVFSER
jgi:hypothetical protein